MNEDRPAVESLFMWSQEQVALAPDASGDGSGAVFATGPDVENGQPSEATEGLTEPDGGGPRRWQARPHTPVINEDDEWAEGHRLPNVERGRLIRKLPTRDRTLLALLAEHSYLTTEDVAALLFPSMRTAQDRLLHLRPPIAKRRRGGTVVALRNETGLGLVMRWSRTDPQAGSWRRLPAAWLLRQKGAIVLATLRNEDAVGIQETVKRAYNAAEFATQLDHDLGAISFFSRLVLASRDLSDQGLYTWLGERRARAQFREKKSDLAPDGWGRYIAGPKEVTFLLEWDRSSEPPPTITSKAEGYSSATYAGAVPPHILWVADREPRERSIRQAIERAASHRAVPHWTTTAERLDSEGVLGLAWQPINGGPRQALPAFPGQGRKEERKVADCLGKSEWWERRVI